MREKRNWKLLKNNLLSVTLVLILIIAGAIIAGNVFVDQGSVEVDDDLNVTGTSYLGDVKLTLAADDDIGLYIDGKTNDFTTSGTENTALKVYRDVDFGAGTHADT